MEFTISVICLKFSVSTQYPGTGMILDWARAAGQDLLASFGTNLFIFTASESSIYKPNQAV